MQLLSMQTDNCQTEPILVDQPGLIHSNECESLAGDQILDSKGQIASHTHQSTQARRSNNFIQTQQTRNTAPLVACLLIRKAQQREEVRVKVGTYKVRVKVGMYKHEQQ